MLVLLSARAAVVMVLVDTRTSGARGTRSAAFGGIKCACVPTTRLSRRTVVPFSQPRSRRVASNAPNLIGSNLTLLRLSERGCQHQRTSESVEELPPLHSIGPIAAWEAPG